MPYCLHEHSNIKFFNFVLAKHANVNITEAVSPQTLLEIKKIDVKAPSPAVRPSLNWEDRILLVKTDIINQYIAFI